QVVGALPLLAPLADRLSGGRFDRRQLARALALAAALYGGWFAVEWARFGGGFVRAHLWLGVALRSQSAMLQMTRPTFYLGMLWRREGPLILVAAVGLLYAAWRR